MVSSRAASNVALSRNGHAVPARSTVSFARGQCPAADSTVTFGDVQSAEA
jgi:hypothetical protein